jgi:hypothetical protein
MQSFLGATLVMPKSDPWEDEALPVLPALGPVSVRKADTCRSPPPYRPAGSFLAARPSPPCGWCGRCRDRACQRGRSLPAESAIGRVLSYGSPLLATNVAAVDEKRPVIRFQKSSKVLNGLDVNESRGDIPIRRVSHRCPGTYPAARRRDCHAQLSGLRCAAVLCTEPEKGPHAGRTTKRMSGRIPMWTSTAWRRASPWYGGHSTRSPATTAISSPCRGGGISLSHQCGSFPNVAGVPETRARL